MPQRNAQQKRHLFQRMPSWPAQWKEHKPNRGTGSHNAADNCQGIEAVSPQKGTGNDEGCTEDVTSGKEQSGRLFVMRRIYCRLITQVSSTQWNGDLESDGQRYWCNSITLGAQ